ncbi:Rieske (2Fe-2S) protein [Neptunomonas antarctica]|uniref:Ferredoxin subunit of nitrite reductase or a ring-hydroxylating dioxygenase n=1 Tax=Neptunomonas antarctica TaxID=619304 RepID=A0A1N7PLG3_9GAMM|nr:Rieske (2Fe-2S) protein [Neptunomonas antarctica]SIT11493.1 Ferredoxin subunit of nitrite reductase or a ring-hydroxylating dioxygenase [Neptunomonas antarctica]
MHLLCTLDTLAEDVSKGFQLADVSLVAVNKCGHIYVYLNQCPHRGVPLEWQPDQFLDLDKNFIQCATHGALFRIEDGECIAGPCPGEMLTKIPCKVEQGEVWINLSSLAAAI